MDGDLKRTVAALSGIERPAIHVLRTGEQLSEIEIASRGSLNIDSVRRAIAWLKEKELVDVDDSHPRFPYLTQKGLDVELKKLPEIRMMIFIKQCNGKATLEEIGEGLSLGREEVNIALGIAKRNAWVSIHKGEHGIALESTGLEKDALEGKYRPQELLRLAKDNPPEENDLNEEDKKIFEDLAGRGLVKWAQRAERLVQINDLGKSALKEMGAVSASTPRTYDIHSPVPEIFAGKRQPYVQFLNRIRRNMVELGFKEMKERLIVQEFYNFDVLFQPQNHPARAWTDSYTMKQPKAGTLPAKKIVDAVRKAHETGGVSKSKGWGYEWSEKIASRLMPNAHGTTADARQMVQGIEVPGKYFVINRCYRPDVVDATHLVEFNQCDGFIAGEGLNFRSLLGVLKQFALEVAGAEKVKFLPDYYPFTEPSVQLSALHPEMGWIEFAGAGIFRPEITETLGIKEPVIAWGMGIDRLAMFKLGIKDIRHLFSDDINWLRNAPLLGVE